MRRGNRLDIAAAFLFFCSTGLFFGQVSRRRPAVAALAGLVSIALILVYLNWRDTIGPVEWSGKFLVPYFYFVSSAVVLGRGHFKRPTAIAAGLCVAIAFATLAYPQMYETIDWLHRKSTGAYREFTQLIFHDAERALGWIATAGMSPHAQFVSEEIVLQTLVAMTMVLFFVLSGLASRLLLLSTARRSPASS